jgi:hypothetical protein
MSSNVDTQIMVKGLADDPDEHELIIKELLLMVIVKKY